MMQKNSRKLVLGALLTSAALGFNTTSRADCDPMTARQMLEDEGWTYEAETDEQGQGIFTVVSDGIKAQTLIERDGDLQFIAFYINNGLTRQESLEWINEASSRLNYVQMWLDEDEDVAVMYSVAEWNNICPKNLSDNIKLFISLMKSVGELHPMNRI